MMISLLLPVLFLLLPIAAASGWFAARKHYKPIRHDLVPKDYFVGLNFLLNEQPDKAVEVFIKMLEVNSETVETHLALGNLFRRQGEVDRAIRIHQNLIARPNLVKYHRTQALHALAKDYLSAGVLDRSERLFLDVLELDSQNADSLKHLLDIYQTEKSWEQAIEIAKKITQVTGKNMDIALAHYHCELAELALTRNEPSLARQLLKRALNIDRQCIRANFLQSRLEANLQQYPTAIRILQNVQEQMADFFSETVPHLLEYARTDGKEKDMIDYFNKIIPDCPRISIALVLTKYFHTTQSPTAAIDFLINYLTKHPSLYGLHHLVLLLITQTDTNTQIKLNILQTLLETILKNKPNYLCHNCGFSGKTLLWLCPGCKNWSSIKPILGLEGE